MDTQGLALAILGIAVGAVLSWVLSKYYYHRTQQLTRLTASIVNRSRVIRKPDKYEGDLEIRYRGNIVNELHQSNLFVGNSGNRAIQGNQSPITLELPGKFDIVDLQVARREPPERQVAIRSTRQDPDAIRISVEFGLLNANEYFTLKILSLQPLETKDPQVKTQLPDLPATFPFSRLPTEWYAPLHGHPRFRGRAIAFLSALGLVGAAILMAWTAQFLQAQTGAPWHEPFGRNAASWTRIALLWGFFGLLLFGALAALSEALKFKIHWGRHVPCFKMEHEAEIPHFQTIRPKLD